MEGADVGLHLVFVFGFRHQHARDKSAQRQAQPGNFGQPRQPEGDEQQVQHEQFFAAPPCHEGEPPTHHLLPAHQQQGDQHRGLQHGHAQRIKKLVGGRAQRRDQHQQRHHGQVLEQQDAHDAFAVFTLQLQPFGHEFDHDGRATHRQRTRQRHRCLPAHVPVRRKQPGQE